MQVPSGERSNGIEAEIVFVAGVEGSGHGLVRSILDPWLRGLDVESNSVGLETVLLRMGKISVTDRWASAMRIDRSQTFERRHEAMRREAQMLLEGAPGATYFMSPSYPYNAGGLFGRRRSIFNQPNLVALHSAVQGLCNLKVVKLTRNSIDACMSTLSRKFEGDPRVASRVHFSNLAELDRQVRKVSERGVRIHDFDFDTAMDNPSEVTCELGKFLNLDSAVLDPSVIDPQSLSIQNSIRREIVEDFFSGY